VSKEAFERATILVFGPDDMDRSRCVLCGGVDAHLPVCNEHLRRSMHTKLVTIRDRVAKALGNREGS